MDEKKLKKQLVRMSAAVITVSMILCVAVFGVLTYVLDAAHDADHVQMKAETLEYESRILKQIDKNFQILNTMAKSYEISGIIKDFDELEKSISEANRVNSFVSVFYLPIEGTGIFDLYGQGTYRNFTLEDCSPQTKETILRAQQGEQAVSNMFERRAYDGRIFIYSVPVYENGEIIGLLSAGDTLEIFEDIVNGNFVMNGEGYVHLLNENGDFLVRSENTIVKENINTIFDGSYLTGETKRKTLDALSNQESIYGDFEYRGEQCHFYIEPMGLNGWNLFCVNKLWGSTLSFGRIIFIVAGVFFSVLIILLAFMFYAYYRFRKNAALLLHFAYFDTVTGARNTLKFDHDLQEFTKKHKEYSIVALNIHNFKGINDLFGKNQGDRVLCYLKKVIEDHLNDEELVCRDAGDLFYLLLTETDRTVIKERLEAIIGQVKQESSHAEYSYEISLYAGVAVEKDREKALVALQGIRQKHHINITFYDEELHEKLRKRGEIESYMQLALENREFKLFLQPKNDLKNDEIIGAEALVRWQKPDGSYRYPNEFIPLFEENGFCIKLDMYMLERVCEQIRAWIDSGIEPIPISVNQSKMLFANGNYPEVLTQLVNRYQIPPSLITLEILERTAVDDFEQISSQIDVLRSKGFKVSMDDFGSGYSSLNMLYQLNVDELKLDRGFLRQTSHDDNDRRLIILEQIISFAKKLGVSTVAEGIETQLDKDTMVKLACDYGQGYFYERPISAEEFSERYMAIRVKKNRGSSDKK